MSQSSHTLSPLPINLRLTGMPRFPLPDCWAACRACCWRSSKWSAPPTHRLVRLSSSSASWLLVLLLYVCVCARITHPGGFTAASKFGTRLAAKLGTLGSNLSQPQLGAPQVPRALPWPCPSCEGGGVDKLNAHPLICTRQEGMLSVLRQRGPRHSSRAAFLAHSRRHQHQHCVLLQSP